MVQQGRFFYNHPSINIGRFVLIFILISSVIACASGGGGGGSGGAAAGSNNNRGIEVLDLRIYPASNGIISNATLVWNNPNVTIEHINISYKASGADNLTYWPALSATNEIAPNEINVTEVITGLEELTYTFNVRLVLGGADENRTVSPNSVPRLIGPNLDGDEYADADPKEKDEDGDGVIDDVDDLPRDRSGSVDADNDTVDDITRDLCISPNSARNWRAGEGEALDADGDGCRAGVRPLEDHFDNNPEEYAARVSALRVTPMDGAALLTWTNPVAVITQINISHKLSIANSFETPPTIISSGSNIISGASDISQLISGLTSTNSNYTFKITLTLGGADADSDVAAVNISRIIGPNRDGDGYADADQLETDEDNDGVLDSVDLCNSASSATNWKHEVAGAVDADGDGCRSDTSPPEDALDSVATEFADSDGDGVGDIADVDDNNNGLIDIRTADELNQVRYNLDGTFFKTSADDAGSNSGCQGGSCNGYDLMNDIDLAGFDIMSNVDITGFNTAADIDKINLAGYNNWQPIGTCDVTTDGSTFTILCRDSDAFNAIFDGNGFTISNMRIAAKISINDPDAYGIGLFGAIGPNAVLRDIHIRDGSITDGAESIGLLVGHAMGSDAGMPLIVGSSAQGKIIDSLNNARSLGGLVGAAHNSRVSSSYVLNSEVKAKESIGGLIGSATESNIASSYVLLSNMTSRLEKAIGGLVGFAQATNITHSYTREGMATTGFVGTGSLVGNGIDSLIEYSYSTMTVSHPFAGILFGFGDTNTITTSYWDSDIITNGALPDAAAKSTSELQTPIDYTGIYSEWGNAWCDPVSGNFTVDTTSSLYAHLNGRGDINDFRAWDFGTNMTYPALTCTQGGTAIQR